MSPLVSVVVTARNGGDELAECLAALERSDLGREGWELIVVDDASDDQSAAIAARNADIVIRLPGRSRGPAYCRNRGIEAAHGEILVFVEADVRVHRDALRRVVEVFATDPGVSAVFGAYDAKPSSPDLISQYWNLVHHYYAHRHGGDAKAISGGCVALRRASLAQVGAFDEWRLREAAIENVELGTRLEARGLRVAGCAEIQSTSMKCWSAPAVVRSVWSRGAMLSRVVPERRGVTHARSDVVRSLAGSSAVILCGTLLGALLTSRMGLRPGSGALLSFSGLTLMVHGPETRFLFARRGALFALAALPAQLIAGAVSLLALLYGWLLRHLLGEPQPDPTTQAFAEVGVQTWPPVPRKH